MLGSGPQLTSLVRHTVDTTEPWVNRWKWLPFCLLLYTTVAAMFPCSACGHVAIDKPWWNQGCVIMATPSGSWSEINEKLEINPLYMAVVRPVASVVQAIREKK